MIYGSVCSGIEAASVAWHPLGWKPALFSEIEKFPSAGHAHHYPAVPNHGDMTKFKALGNSMAVPCMAWLGQRIEAVQRIATAEKQTAA